MKKNFEFRYQTIKGQEIIPAMTEDEQAAFEDRCNAKATAIFDRYNEKAYVLALLSDNGKTLLRGLIIAEAA
jgi:hypothetical protein